MQENKAKQQNHFGILAKDKENTTRNTRDMKNTISNLEEEITISNKLINMLDKHYYIESILFDALEVLLWDYEKRSKEDKVSYRLAKENDKAMKKLDAIKDKYTNL